MVKLYFVGGSKGVGKSSLAKTVAKRGNLLYINTGDRVREYRPHFDKMFCEELMASTEDTIIDTHYAASSSRTPFDFNMGLDEKYQLHLRLNTSHCGKVVLVEAAPDIVLKRREIDGDPRRCLDITQIEKENIMNNAYARIYASQLNFPFLKFINEGMGLEEASSSLLEVIQNE
jgi:adenylate kinase